MPSVALAPAAPIVGSAAAGQLAALRASIAGLDAKYPPRPPAAPRPALAPISPAAVAATYARTEERGIKWADLEQLARQVRRQCYCRDLLYRGQAEQSYTATGVGVKLRPDLLVRSRAGRQLTLIDFKTTSSPTLDHFLTTIEKYDYDRQAALYLDMLWGHPLSHHRRPEKGGTPPGQRRLARRADRHARPHRAGPQKIQHLAPPPRPPSPRPAPDSSTSDYG